MRGIQLKVRMAVEGLPDSRGVDEGTKAARSEALRRTSAGDVSGCAVLPDADRFQMLCYMLAMQIITRTLVHADTRAPVEWEDVPGLLSGSKEGGEEWICARIDVQPNAELACMASRVVAVQGRDADAAWREVLGLGGGGGGADA